MVTKSKRLSLQYETQTVLYIETSMTDASYNVDCQPVLRVMEARIEISQLGETNLRRYQRVLKSRLSSASSKTAGLLNLHILRRELSGLVLL